VATVPAVVGAAEERRHRPGPEPLWGESWYFDFAGRDGSLGGYVRLGLYPNLGVAWYWAALVGTGRRLVLVRDHSIELPRTASLEVRGQGLWSAVNCETPLDHWSIGLEALAVALDDPTEAYRGERGDLVGLGFDLEWEASGPAFRGPAPAGYGQPCQVSGEVLVGDEQLDFDGTGHRSHAWGVQDWWNTTRSRVSGILSDGATFAVEVSEGESPLGYLSPLPAAGTNGEVGISTTAGPNGLPDSVAVDISGLSLTAAVLGHAPLLLEAPDGRLARLARTLCGYRSPDGRHGAGWAEWLTGDR
jgi:hypothetical protein